MLQRNEHVIDWEDLVIRTLQVISFDNDGEVDS